MAKRVTIKPPSTTRASINSFIQTVVAAVLRTISRGRRCRVVRHRVPSLPVKLIALITAHLRDDPESLLASRLVCHSWNNATLPYVFRRVILSNCDKCEELRLQIQCSPAIGHWVKALCFDIGNRPSRIPVRANWIPRAARLLGRLLPNISYLELRAFRDTLFHISSSDFGALKTFGSIKQLSVRHNRILLPSLISLVDQLPKLASLALEDCTFFSQDTGDLVIREPTSLRVSELSYVRCLASSDKAIE